MVRVVRVTGLETGVVSIAYAGYDCLRRRNDQAVRECRSEGVLQVQNHLLKL